MITCGTIKGGYGYSIIADQVEIVGTTRSFTRDAQETIKSRMSCICCGVAQTYGGEIDLCYEGATTTHIPVVYAVYHLLTLLTLYVNGNVLPVYLQFTQKTSRPQSTATPSATRS